MNKIKYRTIRQEDEYIKQYEKQFNIKRINRIRLLKSKKIEEEISKKEQKIKNYKIRKQTLLEKNVLLSDSIERQKFKLIDDFDNALKNKVSEIYVTIYDRSDEQKRLISLMEKWGFIYWGKKGDENVYVRNFSPCFNADNVNKCYPYITKNTDVFIVPIYPEYHTELLPDSILNTESPDDYIEDSPHRNGISKVYVSRSYEPHPKKGDILVFYRTGGYYKSVVTTIGIVSDINEHFSSENEFVKYCLRGSVFPEKVLRDMWNYNHKKPWVVNFLYVYSFPKRINMEQLINLKILNGINDAPRGFRKISKQQFELILQETESESSFIVD
jgi:hypothetical protein